MYDACICIIMAVVAERLSGVSCTNRIFVLHCTDAGVADVLLYNHADHNASNTRLEAVET